MSNTISKGTVRDARDIIAAECEKVGGIEVLAGMNCPLILNPGVEFVLAMRLGSSRQAQTLIAGTLKKRMAPGNFHVGFYVIPHQTSSGLVVVGG